MPAQPEQAVSRRQVDTRALQRIARRMQQADQAPWLHAETGRRMAERLGLIRLQPNLVLDWWRFNGASAEPLARAYPKARVLAVEPDTSPRSAAQPATRWWSARHWSGHGPAVCAESQVQPGTAGLLWCNMGLHQMADPQAAFVHWHRALQVDGFLMFSTLGPGSLTALQAAYAQAGWPAPFAPFVDMHDLGDMLVQAGFSDPVMDQETVTLTWPNAEAALVELRGLGGNAHPHRLQGLRTPRWRQRLLTVLGRLAVPAGSAGESASHSRVPLCFELVYGHAFKSVPRASVTAQTQIAVDDFKSMLRSRK